MTQTFPAVEVTLDSGFSNVPPTKFVSVVRTTTVQGNPIILDQYGYELRVSPGCVRPLSYSVIVAVVDGKLVCTPAHAGHDTWALISEPGTVWCRTCQQHFKGESPADAGFVKHQAGTHPAQRGWKAPRYGEVSA